MVIVKLVGGLGNQMFQYAFARKLAAIKKVPVKLDNYWYVDIKFGKDAVREYALSNFQTTLPIADRDEVAQFLVKQGFVFKAIRKFKRDILRIDDFSYQPKQLTVGDSAYLEGYWQTEKYFADIRDVLLQEFSLKNGFSPAGETIAQEMTGCNSVSLHIRRGDYVSNKKVANSFGVLGLDHFRNAVAAIKEKVADPKFFVFSDDIKWVADNLDLGESTTYVSRPELKDYEELILMSRCKHNIIANSSFSWWGAWLNQNPGKIVIAPKQWFKTDRMNTKDVVPDGWTKLDNVFEVIE